MLRIDRKLAAATIHHCTARIPMCAQVLSAMCNIKSSRTEFRWILASLWLQALTHRLFACRALSFVLDSTCHTVVALASRLLASISACNARARPIHTQNIDLIMFFVSPPFRCRDCSSIHRPSSDFDCFAERGPSRSIRPNGRL